VPLLVLGPLLRYVGETEATIWVETDQACEVEVLGRTQQTFEVEGHHYALVHVEDLEPGSTTPYTVSLNQQHAWPEPDYPFPQPVVRTPKANTHMKMAWGSCRVSVPHEPPFSLKKDDDPRGREVDALYAYARRMLDQPHEEWPHILLLLGDQVYADEAPPQTREFIRTRRHHGEPPGEEVADFEEYCHLYHESWRDPMIRWLLSTVSTSMIWDDHDVHDDWNTSKEWVEHMRTQHWWNERVVAAFMTYWLYQHWGNLSPRELEDDEVYERVCAADGDAGPLLREFAFKADREVEGTRWSYCRDIGKSRLIVMDSRAGRVLDPGNRQMVDDEEFAFIAEHAREGGFNHLILATTLPVLLPYAMHWLEAWDEAIAEGAWGPRWAKLGEKIRQGLDLEHWAAFQKSFHRVVELVREIGSGKYGEPPASIVFLSGDVHNAYLERVAFKRGDGVRSSVWQGVCSPFRNPLDGHERFAVKLSASRPFGVLTKALAHRAGVEDPGIRWKTVAGPAFDNQVATLDWNGPDAKITLERAEPGDPTRPTLELTFECPLT
jgi:hypothetical protein